MNICKKWLEADLGLIQLEKPLPFYQCNRVKKVSPPSVPLLWNYNSAPIKDPDDIGLMDNDMDF